MRRWVALLSLSTVWSRGALADDAPDVPAPRPASPDARLHDGLFVRLGLGVPVERTSVQTPSRAYSIGNDSLVSIDLAAGFTPLPGLVLAFDVGGFSSGSPTAQGDPLGGQLVGVAVTTLTLLADWYPYPRRGYHLQAYGGFGEVRVKHLVAYEVELTDRYSGTAFGAGTGWETFFSSQWSLGFLLRGHVVHATDGDASASSVGGELVVAFTWH